ncbi:MAG: fused MFS/spermidine synthase [Pseudomonadota bacterium]
MRSAAANSSERIETPAPSYFFLLVLSCFFVSGMTGLIYEILWTRMIVKVIGSAPFAISIVLTVFMGGLGFGSFLAGRSVDRIKQPLSLVRLYGLLEIAIGIYGLVLPLLLIAFKPLYAVVYNHLFHYFLGYNLLTFLGCALLLIVPVTCMGATLPVLSRFFVTSMSKVGTHVGRLYGLNTIGAAVGSLITGFWLISRLGVWGTLAFAIFLNAGIGVICLVVSRGSGKIGPEDRKKQLSSQAPDRGNFFFPGNVPDAQKNQAVYALIIFAVSGFCAMAYEVIWVKLIGLIVGPTTYSFTIVLVTFITCLALGSIFFGWLADRTGKTLSLLFITQILAAVSALCISQLMGNSQIFFAKLIFHFKDSFALLQMSKIIALMAFMFIPTFCLGATFPLVGKICTRSLENTGRSIGFAYAVNTIGAVLGSFCAGFVLIPLMGKENSISLVAAIQLATFLLIAVHMIRKDRSSFIRWAPLFGLVVIGLILAYQFPHWDRKMLSKGKYHRFDDIQKREIGWMEALVNGTEIFSKTEPYELVYFGDGIGGFTTVLKSNPDAIGETTYSLLNSGKADASSHRKDMFTQTMLAHFAMLFHPHPENVLVLGLASGITAGEALLYPSVKQLDGIEINKQVVAGSDFFIPWNYDVLHNPRTELIIQDGRAHLALTDRRYDVIISEPSNPWMAGLATLFTHEFMELAKNRLKENGIYVQWIHSYQMDWPTFSLVGRTFAGVFPNSMLVTTDPQGALGPDYLLVGFQGDMQLDPRVALANLPHAMKSKNMKLVNHLLFYHMIVSEDLPRLFQDGPINTDNNSLLEFSAPKLIHFDPGLSRINKELRANQRLHAETRKIQESLRKDMDAQLDFVEYGLSFNSHGMVDLRQATPEQKQRYRRIMLDYCAGSIVSDFSFIPDETLRNACLDAHLRTIEKNLAAEEDKAPLYYYMGWLSFNNNRVDQSISFLLEVLKTKPEDHETNTLMKKALLRTGQLDIHIERIQEMMAAQHENPALPYHLATLFQQKKMMPQAVTHLEKALSIRPGFMPALNQIALLYSAAGDHDRAIQYFQKMVEVKPDLANAYYNIACLYAKQNKVREATDWLRSAVEKGYDNLALIKTDKDLDNVRGSSAYMEIVTELTE